MQRPEQANRFVVNIGAGDGKSCEDPCFALFQLGYSGVAIEGSANPDLALNLPEPTIQKLTECIVTPFNVATILEQCNTPSHLDFLKIDIDGYDGAVLNKIFEAGYRPKVVQAEINPEIPPPIEFSVLYHPQYRCQDSNGKYTGFYGMSFAFIARLAARHGYHIAFMDNISQYTHDVILVGNDFAGLLDSDIAMDPQSLRRRYLDHPPPEWFHFNEYGFDPMTWRYRTDSLQLAIEVWNACLICGSRKHSGSAMPFFFDLAE